MYYLKCKRPNRHQYVSAEQHLPHPLVHMEAKIDQMHHAIHNILKNTVKLHDSD